MLANIVLFHVFLYFSAASGILFYISLNMTLSLLAPVYLQAVVSSCPCADLTLSCSFIHLLFFFLSLTSLVVHDIYASVQQF